MKVYIMIRNKIDTRDVVGVYQQEVDAYNDLEQFGQEYCVEEHEVLA